jgi:TPR repeat protein
MYEYGYGVLQDLRQAARYYHAATEQRYPEAMYHLALMYAYGRGEAQDFTRARHLLDLAAREHDHAPSMYYIGKLGSSVVLSIRLPRCVLQVSLKPMGMDVKFIMNKPLIGLNVPQHWTIGGSPRKRYKLQRSFESSLTTRARRMKTGCMDTKREQIE